MSLFQNAIIHVTSLCHWKFEQTMSQQRVLSLVYAEFGSPATVLKAQWSRLDPAALQAVASTHVLVRLVASPVNPADLNQIQGVYPTKPLLRSSAPQSPEAVDWGIGGNEGLWEVLDPLESGGNWKKGDWAIPTRQGLGLWRSHALVESSKLYKIPERTQGSVSPDEVAQVAVNPCTGGVSLLWLTPTRP
jgi:trans-2-enoyl-CoA reductase